MKLGEIGAGSDMRYEKKDGYQFIVVSFWFRHRI